jgi:hypothetical protein
MLSIPRHFHGLFLAYYTCVNGAPQALSASGLCSELESQYSC